MRIRLVAIAVLILATACTSETAETTSTSQPEATTTTAVAEAQPEGTQFGFFPFPNGTEFEDVLAHFQDLADHGEVVIVQPEVPWEAFVDGTPAEDSARMENVRNVTELASIVGLEPIYVVDPLNGLDRKQFIGLPADWDPNFRNPDVRASFTGFAVWLAAEFQPRWLGLSSEINTYLHAHPDDNDAYLDLYRTTRAAIKAVSPDTQVFVTFQWGVVHGLADGILDASGGLEPQWDQIERFEPDLDVWAISSYPMVFFPTGDQIFDDYYSRLADRTDKPLAVAEGGFPSQPTGPFPGDEQSQVDHLMAIHDQIGHRLEFWAQLILDDFDPQAIVEPMREQGRAERDIEGLGLFSAMGIRNFDTAPKPALAVWDGFRAER